MQVLARRKEQSAIRRIFLATGCGAILGFQAWKLAAFGFAVSIPWHGQACIWLGHVVLGCAIGATAGWANWWKRACVFGPAFTMPAAWGARTLGLSWAPDGIAVITEVLAAAFLIAFLADAIFPREAESLNRREPEPSNRRSPEPVRLPGGGGAPVEERCLAAQNRLAEEKASLDRLDREREHRGDPSFGRPTEDRIVWGELLDLELQDIDEQLNRICRTAGNAPDRRPHRPDGGPRPSSK
jgi:hypothetical protein